MNRPDPMPCAIYTRKSSEEGLEQSFNSLHAQREACEAYIKVQAHEGWKLVKTAYDDGGISGGTMERPALQRLLADVDAGRIRTIVVYKIDRLTRSLADFARIVERLDRAGASFVSVTQASNTTTSMGRLTLNVLLSFAQFEREVTGERIRDKIRASKQRGMWMGGIPPLGYDPPTDPATRTLVPNEAEAATVRMIFERYLALGCVARLREDLDAAGIRSKAWTTKAGRRVGGLPFSRGALYHLLRNRIIRGELRLAEGYRPEAHPAIVSEELFDAVQMRLDSQRVQRHRRRTRQAAGMQLTGRLFDRDGHPMSPSFAYGRGGKPYRYYVSSPLQHGQRLKPHPDALRRVPVEVIEGALKQHLPLLLEQEPACSLDDLLAPVTRIDLERDRIHLIMRRAALPRHLRLRLEPHPTDPALGLVTLAIRCRIRAGRSWAESDTPDVMQPHPDPVLIRALRKAHAFAAGLRRDEGVASTSATPITPSNTYERRLTRLAFLAPDLQRAILEGRQPRHITLKGLIGAAIPTGWSDQRRMFVAER